MKLKSLLAASVAMMFAAASQALSQDASAHPDWPAGGQLFVGTCYQPVDRTPEQIRNDIALMKKAGFTVVRMGDLSWDYFERAEGVYDFKAFDEVMDEMQAAGIKVILDISGAPAPIWLHHRYPGVDIVAQNETTQHPAERYMDDISDPDYKRLIRDFAETLTRHYAHHPALFAIGFDNEVGNGYMSYSEGDRQRFVDWLKDRYGDLDSLNKAWATQRWSRRIDSWDEIELPYGDGVGPFERYLDLHRFWSDMTIKNLRDLEAVRERNIPDKPAISNLWPTAPRKGFDYLSSYRDYVSYGAEGFYPGAPASSAFDALMMRGGLNTPLWFNEFTVVMGGNDYGRKGRSRMWAYMGLIDGEQALLAWNFNSHLGGEEEALFGLVNHDNSPSWKLDEFGRIASEFKTLQTLGFPRDLKPQVAFAYSFETQIATTPASPSNTIKQYIAKPYIDQAYDAYTPMYDDNIDEAVINIGHEDLSRYKLVVVPGDYLMDPASANAIREYVKAGGTVIMTAQSAKVDEHNQWFDTPLPGRLSDVFGLKTNEFYHNGSPLKGTIGGRSFSTASDFYEVVEPSTAHVVARLSNIDGTPPAVTANTFGKGQAIYVATLPDPALMRLLYRSLYAKLGIVRGPQTPAGVYARVVAGRTLYVNSTTQAKDVPVAGEKRGILSGKLWRGHLHLNGYGVDLVE